LLTGAGGGEPRGAAYGYGAAAPFAFAARLAACLAALALIWAYSSESLLTGAGGGEASRGAADGSGAAAADAPFAFAGAPFAFAGILDLPFDFIFASDSFGLAITFILHWRAFAFAFPLALAHVGGDATLAPNIDGNVPPALC